MKEIIAAVDAELTAARKHLRDMPHAPPDAPPADERAHSKARSAVRFFIRDLERALLELRRADRIVDGAPMKWVDYGELADYVQKLETSHNALLGRVTELEATRKRKRRNRKPKPGVSK